MNGQERIWILLSRQLTGEATEAEIAELTAWQQQHPEMSYSLQILADLWKSKAPDHSEAPEHVFDQHLLRMEALTPPPATPKPPATPVTPATPPFAWQHVKRPRLLTIHNYLKTTWRSLYLNKTFSTINISGLAIGITSAVLLLLWIHNEVSADRFHKNADRIYQVFNSSDINGKTQVWNGTPMVLGPVLQSGYPAQVEQIVRTNWVGAFILNSGDQHLQTYGYLTDPGFLTMFSFPLLEGDAATALNGAHSIVLTEATAKRLFGDREAMGETIRIDSNALFKVTGILRDIPPNTRFQCDYLVPWSYTKEVGWEDTHWSNQRAETFVLLRPGVTETTADTNIRNIIHAHAPRLDCRLFLHPMSKWRLYSEFENGKIVGGEIRFIRLLLLVAGFILLIACINYMNLGTARSIGKARAVGIRKLLGAGRGSLIGRFFGESILTAFLAGAIALAAVQLLLPWFDRLVEANLKVPYGNPLFWLAAIGFLVFTGVLAGSYPAFYLSAYKPIHVLKGYFKGMNGMLKPRKLLVILQFSFAIAFIICTIVIYKQIGFVRNRNIGYKQDRLVFTFIKGNAKAKYEAIRSELLSSGAATEVIRTNSPVTDIWSGGDDYSWQGKDTGIRSNFIEFYSDHSFASTLGLPLLAGRDIDISRYPGDSSAIVLSASALHEMGFSSPIGQHIRNQNKDWHVVGVVKDFVTGTPFYPTSPIVIKGPIPTADHNYWFGTITCKLNDQGSMAEAIYKMTEIFKKYNPDYPFEYHLVGDYYAEKFAGEQKAGSLAAYFAGLSILISCLGLFGLAVYTAESRIKEIGVRKVLGASVLQIASLLSKDFLLLVSVAFLIASPFAWWYMNNWLRDYPYRVGISWWIFALAGGLIALIAAGTVALQAVRAAMTRPAQTLRAE
jgi:putative ABC transport system permease protein